MKTSIVSILAAAIAAACFIVPRGAALEKRSVRLSIQGDSDTCAALDVRSSGQIARAEESFTLPRGTALEIDAASHGRIRVRGEDRADFSIQACKIAAAETAGEAAATLGQIAVSRSGARFSATGLSSGQWTVIFIVRAPKDASLDLEARNGPIAVDGVSGRIHTRATNGPLSLRGCGGEIRARASNGPISFSGESGNVSLSTQNGPISIRLSGVEWKGQQLEARAINGPVSLRLPNAFRSGVELAASGHAPIACHVDGCRQASTERQGNQRSIRWNGSSPVVRISTENGPVSVRSDGGSERLI